MAPAFLKVIGMAGGDVGAIIRQYKLPADSVERREIDVPLSVLHAISEEAAAQAKDPNLGLHLATRLPHGSYGLLEYIGRSAASVRQAGERFLRYSRLLNDLVTFHFEARATSFALTQRIEGHPQCVGRHAGEMFIGLVVRYMREITGTDVCPLRVSFAHAAPDDMAELEAFFRAPIAFDHGANCVELPLTILDRPLVSRDPMLFDVLDGQAERLLGDQSDKTQPGEAKEDELEKVRAEVRRQLEDGQPQLARVAKALGTSARTLQRRLEANDTSFQAVVDGVREELARRHIANAKLSLGDIAYLLGFSEISAFTRAFKRWTGMTPSRWRDRSNRLASAVRH
jgi:AraC-like DNA-binding protein